MPTARIPAVLLLTSCLAVGCGGDSKPAATAPAPDGQPKAAAKQGDPPADPTPTADGGEKVKVVEGKAPGGDDRFALQIDPVEGTMGQKGEVVVRVVPKEPWHMNLDFPTSLHLQPPDGVALANASLKKGDARKLDEGSCEFAVEFTPSAAGEHAITGQFKFAVCQDEACSPVTKDVTLKVAVK